MRKPNKKNGGQSTVELGMLIPILALLFFGVVQLVVLFQSSLVTQYGAFVAARAYQVYGSRTLASIEYPHVRDNPYTNSDQTIVEATAEKVIFESLMWEHGRVVVAPGEGHFSLNRTYNDGNDLSRDETSSESSEGAVRVNLNTNRGVDVTYCAPIRFPGTELLFELAKKNRPCKATRSGSGSEGIAIIKTAEFGIEPEVSP